MELEKLEILLQNEKPYRLKQAQKALFSDAVQTWELVFSIPLKTREMLEERLPIAFDFRTVRSLKGGVLKAIIRLKDGISIETVLLRHEGKRNTVCVSSQAGCPAGCLFCSTARSGFKRNLSFNEIIEQVLFFKYYLKNSDKTEGGNISYTAPPGAPDHKTHAEGPEKVTNIVFMGMGEPFLNYANVIKAVRILNDRDKFNIGSRKISISTCGIPEMIEKLPEEKLQVNLAVSLNAPNNRLRSVLMPVNEKYPLEKLLPAVRNYILRTNRRVMFEYVLISGLNDRPEHAYELAGLLKGLLCFVNLIPFNGKGKMHAPKKEEIRVFKHIIEKNGISVTQRFSFGADISAACGQLVYSSP